MGLNSCERRRNDKNVNHNKSARKQKNNNNDIDEQNNKNIKLQQEASRTTTHNITTTAMQTQNLSTELSARVVNPGDSAQADSPADSVPREPTHYPCEAIPHQVL